MPPEPQEVNWFEVFLGALVALVLLAALIGGIWFFWGVLGLGG